MASTSQQQCPSASLYDLVTKHWPAAISSSPVVSASGASESLLAQLVDLRNSFVEPNATWFKAHTFSGAIVFPLGSDLVSPLVQVSQPSSSSGSGSGSASDASSSTTNNGGRLRRRFPQGQIPGGGGGTGTGSAPQTTTVQARVPRQFVYIYHSEVVGVNYTPVNASAPPNTLIAKVSNPALVDPAHPCNTVTVPGQPFKQSLPADLAGSLIGCTKSPSSPAVSCFVLNIRPAPDCSIPRNCYGEPASIRSIMQVMARASSGMPTLGSTTPSDESSASRLPVYAWIALAAGVLVLVAATAFFIIRRKRASNVRRASSNSAYAKLTAATHAHSSSSSPGSASSQMLSPPAATAQPPSSSTQHKPLASVGQPQPPQLVVPAARRPPSHLLTPPAANTNLILTTQTLESSVSSPSPAHVPTVAADTLLHVDSTPVALPSHLATPLVRLLTSPSLNHVPTRAFVGLSGDLAAHLSLQDLVDGWVSVLDFARAVARARGLPLALVGQWVVGAIDGLARVAPADARASPRGMVEWYARLASDTRDVGLAAGGTPADAQFVRDVVVPTLAADAQSDQDRVKVAAAAIVAFVRIKSLRPFAVLTEASVGQLVDAKVAKVAEELGRASLARRAETGRVDERVRESVFPGVVDVVDGVVLAHVRVAV
ncbi:hypothetical protein BCR44DRAFT_33936 [Catenaria anguillulae PL171]|uniref:Uncharacterized protein n=1 Tax=Catenaria anguillulae PL171 TaxID=765915 RepID=A0A1Y2HQ67_9FUNG|nr:hypothetical protein BCR44DRAFT_33936 [Catenaria anguillulae PL171]